jgi:fibronectin type 3 domain-containing protein
VPPAPEKVNVTLEGSTAVVKWNPIASKVPLAGYLIYRAASADEEGTALAGPIIDTVYRDKTVKEGKSYVYWIISQTKEGKQSSASAKFKLDVPKSTSAVPFF